MPMMLQTVVWTGNHTHRDRLPALLAVYRKVVGGAQSRLADTSTRTGPVEES